MQDEQQIRQSNQAKTIPAPTPTSQPMAPVVPPDTEPGYAQKIDFDTILPKLKDYYGLDITTRFGDVDGKLQEIVDYAQMETGATDELSIMEYIKRVQDYINVPSDERGLKYVYEYIKLQRATNRLWRERNLMYG